MSCRAMGECSKLQITNGEVLDKIREKRSTNGWAYFRTWGIAEKYFEDYSRKEKKKGDKDFRIFFPNNEGDVGYGTKLMFWHGTESSGKTSL